MSAHIYHPESNGNAKNWSHDAEYPGYGNRHRDLGHVYLFNLPSAIYKLTGARDVADAHPEASVKGIDLSPIQPSWIPPNLKFEVDDYNLDWLDENKYDLVHARELLGTVPNWVEMYRKVLGYVKNHEGEPS